MSNQTVEVPPIAAPWQLTYTPSQAARILGIGASTLNEWRHRGWVECIILPPRDSSSRNAGRPARNSTRLYTHDALLALIERLKAEAEAAS